MFKKKLPEYEETLYTFNTMESVAHNEFKSKHKRWCNCTEFAYYIYDNLIDIECTKCHERINLNRSY